MKKKSARGSKLKRLWTKPREKKLTRRKLNGFKPSQIRSARKLNKLREKGFKRKLTS